MSYVRRCARAPIGNIKTVAEKDPNWEVLVLRHNELCLQYIGEGADEYEGHYIFGFMDVVQRPTDVTTSVAHYGCPSDVSNAALKRLIHAAKKIKTIGEDTK